MVKQKVEGSVVLHVSVLPVCGINWLTPPNWEIPVNVSNLVLQDPKHEHDRPKVPRGRLSRLTGPLTELAASTSNVLLSAGPGARSPELLAVSIS